MYCTAQWIRWLVRARTRKSPSFSSHVTSLQMKRELVTSTNLYVPHFLSMGRTKPRILQTALFFSLVLRKKWKYGVFFEFSVSACSYDGFRMDGAGPRDDDGSYRRSTCNLCWITRHGQISDEIIRKYVILLLQDCECLKTGSHRKLQKFMKLSWEEKSRLLEFGAYIHSQRRGEGISQVDPTSIPLCIKSRTVHLFNYIIFINSSMGFIVQNIYSRCHPRAQASRRASHTRRTFHAVGLASISFRFSISVTRWAFLMSRMEFVWGEFLSKVSPHRPRVRCPSINWALAGWRRQRIRRKFHLLLFTLLYSALVFPALHSRR